MKFKELFEDMCRQYIRKPARFITVSAKTFKSITARRLMNNCLESQHQVVLNGFADYGNAKVCDFWSHCVTDTDPKNGSNLCYENNFVIVFVKGE